ncbi:MAG TPA: NADH-quinone oxidoreductase subunit C [Chloroflexota bacterium]|nr:NADH-quinone oxidoreductase subunit C [Chloroflexota bacterium]
MSELAEAKAADISEAIAQKFGPSVLEQSSFRDECTSVVTTDALLDILKFLRDERGFNHLSDVTAVDWLGRQPRFDVIYQLFSFETHLWYRLKVRIDEHDTVPTVVGLWPCANWAEREVYDLFGLYFHGHPALHRIMMPEGWVGHPLRKDYPMSQITLPRSGATKMPE